MRLNLDAQVDLVRAAMHLLRPGGRIVCHEPSGALHGVKPVYDGYEPVAASKKAGEEALRKTIPELAEKGIRLVVVSRDLIEGTITPKLLQRKSPRLLEARRVEAGTLPDVDEFAAAIVEGASAVLTIQVERSTSATPTGTEHRA